MTTLTTADLTEKLVAFLPSAFDTKSALSAAGATNVSFTTNIVKNISTGGASVVTEGAVKPVTQIKQTNAPLVAAKLVHLWTTTDEFEDTPEGQESVARFIQETTASLVKSFDILVLNGTNPHTGEAVVGPLADNAVKSKAKVVEFDAATEDINEALYGALADVARPDYLLLSDAGYSEVGFSADNIGNKMNVTRDAEFTYGPGIPTHRFQAVGIDGYTPDADIKNANLAIAGPFSKIVRTIDTVTVRKSTEATVGDVSMFEQNMSAYLVEVGVKYYNLSAEDDFVVLERAA